MCCLSVQRGGARQTPCVCVCVCVFTPIKRGSQRPNRFAAQPAKARDVPENISLRLRLRNSIPFCRFDKRLRGVATISASKWAQKWELSKLKKKWKKKHSRKSARRQTEMKKQTKLKTHVSKGFRWRFQFRFWFRFRLPERVHSPCLQWVLAHCCFWLMSESFLLLLLVLLFLPCVSTILSEEAKQLCHSATHRARPVGFLL